LQVIIDNAKFAQKEKLAIDQVSLVNVTDQYIDYLRQGEHSLNAEEVGDFVRIATFLLKMKLRYVLNLWQMWTAEDGEEAGSLLDQLKLYDLYHRQILDLMKDYDWSRYSWGSRPRLKQSGQPLAEDVECHLEISTIAGTAAELLQNWQKRFKNWQIKQFKSFDIKEKIFHLADLLRDRKSMTFGEIKKDLPREEVIALFLAILELVKQKSARVSQSANFQDLIIES
ncbi:MAG TPA: segregation/condensation protein A, partial [bacterium]|nr:segregation/condensation protein A [bacterium]